MPRTLTAEKATYSYTTGGFHLTHFCILVATLGYVSIREGRAKPLFEPPSVLRMERRSDFRHIVILMRRLISQHQNFAHGRISVVSKVRYDHPDHDGMLGSVRGPRQPRGYNLKVFGDNTHHDTHPVI